MDYNKFVFNIIICVLVFLYLIYDKCNLYFWGFGVFLINLYRIKNVYDKWFMIVW